MVIFLFFQFTSKELVTFFADGFTDEKLLQKKVLHHIQPIKKGKMLSIFLQQYILLLSTTIYHGNWGDNIFNRKREICYLRGLSKNIKRVYNRLIIYSYWLLFSNFSVHFLSTGDFSCRRFQTWIIVPGGSRMLLYLTNLKKERALSVFLQ